MKKSKRNKILFSILIFITIIMIIGIISWIKNIQEDSKKTKEFRTIIKEQYHNLEENIQDYNEVRTSLANKLQNIYIETLPNDYQAIQELLLEIEQNIKEDKEYIKLLDDHCKNQVFSENKVNTICSTYPEYYEKLVNIYWNDIIIWNQWIKNYNDISDDKLEEYISSEVTDYIDYNQDGNYSEKRDES